MIEIGPRVLEDYRSVHGLRCVHVCAVDPAIMKDHDGLLTTRNSSMAINRQQAAKLLDLYKMREDLQARRERLSRDNNSVYNVTVVLDDGTKIATSIPRPYIEERMDLFLKDLDGQILTNGGIP